MKKNIKYIEFNASIPNRRILFSAKSFHDSALSLERSGLNVVPQVVCLAFSIELYLKSLNSKTVCDPAHIEENEHGVTQYHKLVDKPNKYGHDFKKLFNALDEKHKTGMSECWNNLGYDCEHGSLIDLIEKHKDIFNDWRYPFEGNIRPVNLTQLTGIAECFDRYTGNIKLNG